MKRIFILSIFSLFFLSCEKEDSFNTDYNFLYGDWVPKQVDAGMSFNADPKLLGDIIQITEKCSYKVITDNKIVEEGNIDIISQSVDKLTFAFKSKKVDSGYSVSASMIRISSHTLGLIKYTNDSIALGNNATDWGYYQVKLSRK